MARASVVCARRARGRKEGFMNTKHNVPRIEVSCGRKDTGNTTCRRRYRLRAYDSYETYS